MKIQFCISLGLLAIFASYGCGGGSSEMDMKEAQKAMEHATSSHADNLAPTDFQQAQKTWAHAQAAAKEGKVDTAKVLFVSAKIYFNKSAVIAKAKRDALSRELSALQLMISSNFDEVKSDLSRKDVSPKLRNQVKAIASEVEEDNAAIDKLVDQEDLLKAVAKAKDVQMKVYNAQLILAGQRPSSK
jgi:membrane-associated HD superfamily phosphohydrolase